MTQVKTPVKKGRIVLRALLLLALLMITATGIFVTWFYNIFPQQPYTAEDFAIETIHTQSDVNMNGVDDYTDIVLGARLDAENMPTYDPAYFIGGYPPDDIGVCSDVVWRALSHAGYDLKALIDEDIRKNPDAYPGLDNGVPDPNIDFRRVRNLVVFFERNAVSLTTDIYEIDQWQPGDIVTFSGYGTDHIGVISDKRNSDGIPWLIHNSGQPRREEDALEKLLLFKEITGHFRWSGTAEG